MKVMNLKGMNMKGLKWKGINMKGMIMKGMNLKGMNMKGMNMKGFNMKGMNIKGMNLKGMNMKGINLKGMNMKDRNMKGRNMKGMNMKGMNMKGIKLKVMNLKGMNMKGMNMKGMNMKGMNIKGINMNMKGMNLKGIKYERYEFERYEYERYEIESYEYEGYEYERYEYEGYEYERYEYEGYEYKGHKYEYERYEFERYEYEWYEIEMFEIERSEYERYGYERYEYESYEYERYEYEGYEYERYEYEYERMLWEQKTEKVVMLTNLIEEGKAKCEKYWPDSGKTMFGEIKVKLKETHHFADFIIRKIELEKKDESTRTLTHYHFTSWPDQGVPLTPWALVDFEQKVDASKATSPIVVHCSAGVGRTGTFIALHNIMRQAEETGYVDFYNTLAKLREDRTLMIQTADQYIFLHKAAQAAIVCIGTTVTSNDIRNRIKHLEENGLNGISNMEKEFNNICATCMDRETQSENADNIYQNTESITTETNSDERNRFPSITPRNSYRPYLNCETQEMESYINAVFVPGFQKKDQHLLTQLPMPTTFIDFWRLVTQYKVSLVVAFEVDSMMTDKTIANYLPSGNQPMISSALEIHSESIKEDSLWEEQTLKVTINNSVSKPGHHSLIHLKCKDTELNARKLLNLVNKSRSYNAQVDGRILYTCRDGASLSGLACVLSLLLDRMHHDSCLTVPLVVGSIKSIRPEVIPTFEQYKMLYEALNRYNETTATYSNMDESIFITSTNSIKGPSPQPHTDDGNVYHNM
ncbi:hypothetical protein Btru_017776 [Bulinus truncatus]|nr:hypothetical protein Btru_017776 [Bulinus truncatus]